MEEEPQLGELVSMPARDDAPVSVEDRALVLEFVLMALMGRLCALGVFSTEDVFAVLDKVEGEALAAVGDAVEERGPDATTRRLSSAIRRRCAWLRGMVRVENGS